MNPWTKFVQNISAKLAFFPPSPTYEVLQHKDGTEQLYIQPKYSELPRVLNCTVKKLKTKKRRGGGGGDEIVAAFIPYVPRNSTKRVDITILYSHGNAVDLGQLMPFYKDLSRALKANIMAYDYTGYGGSTGQATVQNTLADVEAVFTCLQQDFGIPPASIVAYGQSVGSGPTAWLAANHKGLAGVVMHTPLLSGIRVLNPGLKWWPSWADVYPNHLLVSKIECPLLVLHGTEDEVIHFSHGKRMHELARNKVEPLWAVGYNHQNLELCPQYLPRLRRFLADLFPGVHPPPHPSSSSSSAAAASTPSAAALTASPPAQNIPLLDAGPPARPATSSGNLRATWSLPITAPERREEATRRPTPPVQPILPCFPASPSPTANDTDDDDSRMNEPLLGSSTLSTLPTLTPQDSAPLPNSASSAATPSPSQLAANHSATASPAPTLQPRLGLFSSSSPATAPTRSPAQPPPSGLLSVPWSATTTSSAAAAAPPAASPPTGKDDTDATTGAPAADRPPAARKLLTQDVPDPLSTPSPLVTADILPTASPSPSASPVAGEGNTPTASASAATTTAAAGATASATTAAPAPSEAVPDPTPASTDPAPTPASTDPAPTPASTDPAPTPASIDPAPTPASTDPASAITASDTAARPAPTSTTPPTPNPDAPPAAPEPTTTAAPADPTPGSPAFEPTTTAAAATTPTPEPSPLAAMAAEPATVIAPPTLVAPPSLAPPEKAFLQPGSAITADPPPRPLTAG